MSDLTAANEVPTEQVADIIYNVPIPQLGWAIIKAVEITKEGTIIRPDHPDARKEYRALVVRTSGKVLLDKILWDSDIKAGDRVMMINNFVRMEIHGLPPFFVMCRVADMCSVWPGSAETLREALDKVVEPFADMVPTQVEAPRLVTLQ